jgi:hypothetical protein
MAFSIRFYETKNQTLIATRGVSFTEVLVRIKSYDLLANKVHPRRLSQRIYIIKIEQYAYVVPYVVDHQKKEIFLKTIYPSRKFTKLYLNKGGHNEE